MSSTSIANDARSHPRSAGFGRSSLPSSASCQVTVTGSPPPRASRRAPGASSVTSVSVVPGVRKLSLEKGLRSWSTQDRRNPVCAPDGFVYAVDTRWERAELACSQCAIRGSDCWVRENPTWPGRANKCLGCYRSKRSCSLTVMCCLIGSAAGVGAGCKHAREDTKDGGSEGEGEGSGSESDSSSGSDSGCDLAPPPSKKAKYVRHGRGKLEPELELKPRAESDRLVRTMELLKGRVDKQMEEMVLHNKSLESLIGAVNVMNERLESSLDMYDKHRKKERDDRERVAVEERKAKVAQVKEAISLLSKAVDRLG
ncbi:hypothetical protein P691DRAFT_163514 [Macrolepiota fuliginosa MF-IS2]|uniref:Uncharacterized protein n=1 Tax=Macrolepiota fuliginosa MF-IS2 TaxID=1400762 RepID=A0A9P5XKX4_9AGAR|nr:hypothetical protein P691DRAFT_163514 [Macrolepiota fuliginosa MF-IS2]